jgi:hypothetical protein
LKNGLKKNGLNLLSKNGSKKNGLKKKGRLSNGLKGEAKNNDLEEKNIGLEKKNGRADGDCPRKDRDETKPREPGMANFAVLVKRMLASVVVADGEGGRGTNRLIR